MRQRFPRRARPLVAVAAVTFAAFGVAAASHVARRGPGLYARLAVIQATRAPDEKVREDALAFLKKVGPRGMPAIAARAREGSIPDELFVVFAASASEGEIDLLAGSVVGTSEPRRMAALTALARIHSEAAALAAGPGLADPSPDIRSAARDALRGHPENVMVSVVTQAMGLPSFSPDFIATVLVDEGHVAAAVGPVSAGLRSKESIRVYNALHLARATFPRYPPGADREASLSSAIASALPRFEPGAQLLAIEVLAALTGPEAQQELCAVAASQQIHHAIRLEAIQRLSGRRDPRIAEAFEKMVRKDYGDIRMAAAEALGQVATPKDVERWMDDIEKGNVDKPGREALLRAIGGSGEGAIAPRLITLLRTVDTSNLREALHRVLAKDPKPGIPALIEELNVATPNGLAWVDQELRSVTGHQSRRGNAWRTMEEFEEERVALHKEWRLWWTLNKDKSPDEWLSLAQREAEDGLRSPRGVDRAAAVARLAQLAPPDLEARLLPLLDDPDETVWARVLDAFGNGVTPSGNSMVRGRLISGSSREMWRAARILGVRRDPEAVEPLIDALASKEPPVRRESARALGRLADRRAALPLVPLLRDESNDVRDAARDSISDLADRSVEKALLDGLSSTDEDYQLSCLLLLGRCGSRAAIRPLVGFFRHQSQVVQQSALHSFQTLTGMMPSRLEPGELDVRKWEDMVERRQR